MIFKMGWQLWRKVSGLVGDNLLKNIGVDISNMPDQSVEILVGCEPKVKCRNKFLQKIFTKVFGLKPVYETKQAKVITVKAEDYHKDLNGNLEITFGENANWSYDLKEKMIMDKDRKTYTVSLENSVDETYIMSLTDEQVKVFKWLKDVGYDFTITEQGDVIVL